MSKAVQSMFASIANRYDLANDVLSLGVHRLWRHRAIDFANIGKGNTVCDICCGTGDFSFAAYKRVGKSGRVVGVDFVERMIALAKAKQNTQNAAIEFIQGDALNLPFKDNTFDATTVGFGIRNVDDTVACLKEMKRVLKPNGRAVVLEFGQPVIPIFASIYNFYSKHIIPAVGRWLTGNRQAFEYLPETSRVYPAGKKFIALMNEAGFVQCKSRRLFGGVAYIYLGSK